MSDERRVALATWDGGTLTDEDLNTELAQLGPQGKARYTDQAARRELVASLARSAVLATAGHQLGLDQSPTALRRQREALAAEMVERFEQSSSAEPTDAEISTFYGAHPELFSQPGTIRAARIVVKTKAQADALLAQVLEQTKTDFHAFANLAHEKSEDSETRIRGGELPAMKREQLEQLIGAPALAALQALTPGQIARGTFETEGGFQVVRLLDAQPERIASLEAVREGIAQQLRAEKRRAAWEKFVSELEAGFGLSIDDAAVRAFVVR